MKKFLPLVLVVIVIAGGAYFFSQKSKPASSENSAQKEAVAEMLSDCKYDKDFCAYMAAQAKVMEKGVVVTTSSDIKNFGKSTSEMRMDGAGNVEMNSYKDGKLESSMVVFENVTYIKNQDGSWYAMNTGTNEETETSEAPVNELKDTYEDLSMQIKKVGTEACGNLTCDKYEVISGEKEQNGNFYMWIDNKEHLARKMQTNFENVVSTMEYKYETVKVNKPSPIKEMPTAPSMPTSATEGNDGAASGMPSHEEIEKMMQQYGADGE